MIRPTLIHRYDNEPDILAVEDRGYSDVYKQATRTDFTSVIVIPTGDAQTEIAVVAEATSGQYLPNGGEPWPGRPDRYLVRVDVRNVRYTTRNKVRHALEMVDQWKGQWPVKVADIDHDHLLPFKPSPLSLPGDVMEDEIPWEGAAKLVLVNRFERVPQLRKACIAYYGPQCRVCGFDFEEAWGPVGSGFIHVHHLTPLSSVGSEHQVDPRRDLVPLCPNCHAVAHMKSPPYTITEMKNMLSGRRL